MVTLRNRLSFVVLLLLAVSYPGTALAAGVSARVDQSVLAAGDSLRLTLTLSGDQGRMPQPDLTPLQKDFQVLGSESERNLRIINGHRESTTGLSITLMPLRTGKLTIPSLEVAGMKTTPIAIEVLPAGSPTQGGSSGPNGGNSVGDNAPSGAYFLTAEVDTKTPYVQGQVILKVRFYRAIQFTQGEIADPVIEDALVERLGEDRPFTTDIKGRTYEVLERNYAIFPQKSGPITLPGLLFQGQARIARQRGRAPQTFSPFANDPFFQNFLGHDPFANLLEPTRPVRLHSDPILLEVRPRPTTFTGPWWLPAAQVTLSDQGLSDPVHLKVGDPLTRTVGLFAKGLAATQLPEIPKPHLDGINIYPDQPVIQSQVKGKWILGEREEKWAIVPSQPGTYTLPAIEIPWWDITEDRAKVAKLPARTITVLPAAGTTPPPVAGAPSPASVLPRSTNPQVGTPPHTPVPTPSASTTPTPPALPAITTSPPPEMESIHDMLRGHHWPWVSAGLLLLWLTTLGLWWRQRSRMPPTKTRPLPLSSQAPTSQPDPGLVQTACATCDPHQIAEALLHWGAQVWPHAPPRTLGALGARLDPTLAPPILERLERGLYAPHTPWDGTDFWPVLQPLLIRPQIRLEKNQPEALPSLNPTYKEKM
ncbi:MAG: BatD family protein [Magnetococcales bacterium]|nr:BatD family protein [Magnetococcales bacterium]